MTRSQRELKGVEHSMEEHGQKADDILTKADAEDRDTTPKEKEDVQAHLKAIKALKDRKSELEDAIQVENEAREFGKKLGAAEQKSEPQPKRPETLGEQFVKSEGFKRAKAAGFSGSWSSGQIDLESKATLMEGTLATPGAGAPLVPYDVQSGIQSILFNRLTIASLLASGVTTSNVVRYVVETTATNAAATVAEGGVKPESALAFSQVDEPVRKIATFLPVSDEMLEDAAQIRAYINARLSLFVQQEEEDQLLNGAGAGSDINGLLARVPVANRGVYSTAAGAQMLDHVFQGLTVARQSFLEPDGVVINPTDWASIRILKDGNANYLGGSPYSNGPGQPAETLWGKRVVVTSAVAQNTALVGSFGQAAQVFRRGGLTVEASNSHADFFRTNLTAIRAEERLALAVYRPEAFATVDLNGAAV